MKLGRAADRRRRARPGAGRHHRRDRDAQPRGAPAGRRALREDRRRPRAGDRRRGLELDRRGDRADAARQGGRRRRGARRHRPTTTARARRGSIATIAAIDAAVDIPMLVYNVPSRTIVDLSNETLVERLAKLPNIVGVKDATGDMARASLQRLMCGPDWVMLSGDDPSALGYIAHGGHGCISVTANVAPEACAAFFDALPAPATGTARASWQDRLVRLHKALFLDASPAPTKFALAQLGLCSDEARLPIAPCADAVKPAVLEAMREAGVELDMPQADRREPPRAVRLLPGREARSRPDADRHRGEGAARGPRQHRRILRRAWRAASSALINAHIPEYGPANRFNHEPRRQRKLLMHRKQIDKLIGAAQREGRTLMPDPALFQRPRHGEARGGAGARQEGPRQARSRSRARLEARAGPADAGSGMMGRIWDLRTGGRAPRWPRRRSPPARRPCCTSRPTCRRPPGSRSTASRRSRRPARARPTRL